MNYKADASSEQFVRMNPRYRVVARTEKIVRKNRDNLRCKM